MTSENARVLDAIVSKGLVSEEPTELERHRFAHLTPNEMYGVAMFLEASKKRAGEPLTLWEAIRRAQAGGMRARD